MKTLKFTDENGGKEAWLNERLGKITGSKLKDIIATRGGRKLGSYQLIVESIQGSAALAEEMSAVDAMERGTRLEPVALERFRKETGKKVDGSLLMWVGDSDSIERGCGLALRSAPNLYQRIVCRNDAVGAYNQ